MTDSRGGFTSRGFSDVLRPVLRFPLEKEEPRLPQREDAGSSFVVVAGGPEENPTVFRGLLERSVVIAADGGWRHCQRLGIKPSLLIGDLDTLSSEEVSLAESEGTLVQRFSTDKDQSDLELALLAAHQMGARRLTILGALGGQWDHCLANLLAPLSLCYSLDIWARLITSSAEIYLLGPGHYKLIGSDGLRASFAALSEESSGITLEGFLYPLLQARMAREQTLGLANRVEQDPAFVRIGSGKLLFTLSTDS